MGTPPTDRLQEHRNRAMFRSTFDCRQELRFSIRALYTAASTALICISRSFPCRLFHPQEGPVCREDLSSEALLSEACLVCARYTNGQRWSQCLLCEAFSREARAERRHRPLFRRGIAA